MTVDESRRVAEWHELPIEGVRLLRPSELAAALSMVPPPGAIPYPVPSIFRRPDCENCHAPASGRLEGHPLCRFCRTQGDPERKYRWEGL